MTLPSSLRPKLKSSQQNVPSTLRPKQKKESFGEEVFENVKEFATQIPKGYVEGTLSSVGNVLDLLGLQANEQLPGEKAKRSREFEILQKMEKGEVPSYGEFMELSDDEPFSYTRLPTTPEAKAFLEEFGAPKPQRAGGRYGERIGQFLSPPTGGIKAAGVVGGIGQSAEEIGLPPWAQAGAEMITALSLGKAKTPISSGSPAVQKELDKLKNLGLSDQDLTLARNALEDRGFLKKASKYTTEAESKFKNTTSNLEKQFHSIIEESFPGLKTDGPQAFKKSASELFDSLDDYAREVTIKRPKVFIKAVDNAVSEMERTLAKSTQKQEAIDILKKAKKNAFSNKVSGDLYTNFYKEMNAIGNWGNAKQRESAFGAVKNAIKETFRAQGPEGAKLATALEDANKSWMKYLNAEDVSGLISKVSTDEGINFKKLSGLLQKSDNLEILEKGLGKKQTSNLVKLSDISSNIADFEKSMKGGLAKDLLSQGTLYGLAKAVLTGDLSSLRTMAGVQMAGMFATKLLTDPKYQNISLKLSKAAQNGQWNIVKSLTYALEKKTKQDSALIKKVKPKGNPK